MRRSVDELEEGTTVGEGGGWHSQILGRWDGATSHSPIWKSLVRILATTLLNLEKSDYLHNN